VSLTTPAISSGTLQESVQAAAIATWLCHRHAGLQQGRRQPRSDAARQQPRDPVHRPRPARLRDRRGRATEAQATFHLISQSEVKTDSTGLDTAALAMKFTTRKFKIVGGTVTAL
jgi:hypothetical protein